MTLTLTAKPASGKQIGWIRDLLAERPNWQELLNGDVYETAFDILGNVGNPDPKFVAMSEARALITALLKIPRQKKALTSQDSSVPSPFTRLQTLLETLQPGYYALPRPSHPGTFNFYRVVEVEQGQWAGRRFVNQLIGSPHGWDKRKPAMIEQLQVAKSIAHDPVAAAKLYAAKHTRCCRCNADLSHPRSQVALIGEKCAAEWGWAW